jgi:hypothetical protein
MQRTQKEKRNYSQSTIHTPLHNRCQDLNGDSMARAILSRRLVAVTGRNTAAVEAEQSRGGMCSAVQSHRVGAKAEAP